MYRNYNALGKSKNAMLKNEILVGNDSPKVTTNSSLFFSLLVICCVFFSSLTLNAQSNGIYESYAILSLNGGANAYYDMNAVTANPDFQGSALGSFSTANSLVVKGGQNKTFKCDGGDITNGHLYWRVWLTSAGASGSFNSILMSFVSNDPGGCGGNQTWEGIGGTTNIISGLTVPGNYTLEVYSDANGVPGTAFSSNGGNNYKATFNFCGSGSGALPVGNYAIPGCFATVNAAVAYINANGVTGAGTVQFDIAAGGSETAPSGGIAITATGTATTAIKFVKAAGAAYTITAFGGQTAGALNDAVIKIIGGDYITIDGLTLLENAANTTTAAASNNMTEFGIALFYASGTNGSQYNTLQNNTITLNRAYQNTCGIYSNTRHNATAVTTVAEITSVSGANSFNKVYANTISNTNFGIIFIGSGAATANGFMDNGTDIGGSSAATGNTITNWGGNATAASAYAGTTTSNFCIAVSNAYNDNVSNNNVTSATGTASGIQMGGIIKYYLPTVTAQPSGTITTSINNNTVTVTNNPTGTVSVVGIASQGLSPYLPTATININNNIVQNCVLGGSVALTNGMTCITNSSAAGTVNITGNSIVNNAITATSSTSGLLIGIINSGAGGTVNITNNVIRSMASRAASGQLQCIANTGAVINAVNINNNQLGNATSGLFTSNVASSGALFGIVSTNAVSATCAMSIQGNDFRGITYNTLATCQTLYINFQGTALPFTLNVSNNTFTNLNINSSGSTSFISSSLAMPSGGSQTISNNSIVTGYTKAAGNNVACISDSGASGGNVTSIWNSNNFSNMNLSGATTVSILNNSTTGTVNRTITNNIISNITAGTSTVNAIASTGGGGNGGNGNVISGNSIFNITSSGIINGINYLTGTNANIFKNKIYDLTANTTAGVINGISIAGGNTTSLYNNLIGNLSTPAANATNPLVGINITGGTTVNAYFNTVYLNASSTGTLFGSSAIFAATATNLTLKNNIFVNNSSVGGTGLAAAYRRSSTTLSSYNIASNNNDFVGSTIFNDGTNTDTTIGAYKTRVASSDSLSFSENPNFVSTTGANATFLHINTGVATQLESGGVAVSGITDDFDGTTRNGIPDVGADEFTGIAVADTNAPSIVLVPSASFTCSAASYNVVASISDVSNVSNGATAPRIYYRKNAGTYTSAAGSLTSGTVTSGNWTFTINYGGLGGVIGGDVIDYFIVAQDALGNATGLPSAGIVLTNVNTVTTTPTTPFTYTITGTLSGTYSVGTAGTYPTLTAAINAYNTGCLGGAVIFELIDVSYVEAGSMTIAKHPDASATNTLTIKPASGVTTSVSASAANNAVIRVLGNYVTIDGSNNGTTSRNMTVSNASATAPNVFVIGSTGTTPITNVVVKNTIAINGANSSTAIMTSDGTTIGGEGYFNAISILNNDIRKAFIGCFTICAPGNGTGLTVSNNTLTTSGTDAIRRVGIYLQGVNGATVSGNTIANIEATTAENDYAIWLATNTRNTVVSNNTISNLACTLTANAPTGIFITAGTTGPNNISVTGNNISALTSAGGAVGSSTNGIQLGFTTGDVTIAKNTISNIKNTSATGWGANGILLGSVLTSANCSVNNNFISDVAANGFAGNTADDNGYGITVNAGGGYGIYYNTVNLVSNQTSASGMPSAFLVTPSVTFAGAINLRDNIFANSQTGGSTQRYSILSAAPNTVFSSINYNDYYTTAPNLGLIGVDRVDLAAIQAGFGGNANSKNVAPVFVNAITDLHLIPASNAALDNFGTPIAGITTDIDNTTRSVTTPDMGADEFAGSSTLNLKLYVEGYYQGAGLMRSVALNQGVSVNAADVENITVELHNATSPYALAHTATAMLKTNGTANVTFVSSPSGSFYIVVKTRNTVETWSATAQTVGGTTSYDFSTAATQAFGGNMAPLAGGVFGFYSGEMDAIRDGNIDTIDYPVWETDSNNFESGFFHTDLNGDGNVDTIDYPIWETNSNNFVSTVKP